MVLCGHHKCIIEHAQPKSIPILIHQVCIMNTSTFLSPKTKSLDKWLNYQIVTTNSLWSSYNNYHLKLPSNHVFTLSPNRMPNNPHNPYKMNLFLSIITPRIMMPLKTNLIIHCAFIISTPHPYSMFTWIFLIFCHQIWHNGDFKKVRIKPKNNLEHSFQKLFKSVQHLPSKHIDNKPTPKTSPKKKPP